MCVGCHLKASTKTLISPDIKNEIAPFHEILMNCAINIVQLLKGVGAFKFSFTGHYYYLFTCDRQLHTTQRKLKKLFTRTCSRNCPPRVIEFSKIGRLDPLKRLFLFSLSFKYFMHIFMHISFTFTWKWFGSKTVKTCDNVYERKWKICNWNWF